MSKEKAKIKFDTISKNPERVYIIHYSCESFVDKQDGYTPRISSIAIKNYDSSQTYSFSIHKIAELKKIPKSEIEHNYDELEKEMLKEYFDFIKTNNTQYYVHWNMRDINYGFEAIKHRYRVLGGQPIDIDDSRRIDLSKILIDYYGTDYIEHPRLERLIDKNKISKKNFLTGAEEAQCFIDKEYIKLHSSTLYKVDAMANIITRHLKGKLKTNTNKLQSKVEDIFTHWSYRVITMILSLYGLFKLVIELWP
jgi:hypothetical protein